METICEYRVRTPCFFGAKWKDTKTFDTRKLNISIPGTLAVQHLVNNRVSGRIRMRQDSERTSEKHPPEITPVVA